MPVDTGPRYQHLPDLTDKDRERLKQSIAEYGVLVPIDVDEEGRVLDGHQRLMLAAELGLSDPPRRVLVGLTEAQKRYHANAVNLYRRHLDRPALLEAIRRWLREAPQDSDRSIGDALGVDHKTVGARRDELEGTGEIPQFRGRGGRGVRTGEPVPEGGEAEPEAQERTTEDAADHRQMCWFDLVIGYPAPSSTERGRGKLPYLREQDRREWSSGRRMLTSPAPKNPAEAQALVKEMAEMVLREIVLRDPLVTMRAT